MNGDVMDSGALDWLWDGKLAKQGYTDHDLRTLACVLGRACPTCDAGVGAWCRTTSGRSLAGLDRQHTPRRWGS